MIGSQAMRTVGRISASVIRRRATPLLDYAVANPTYKNKTNLRASQRKPLRFSALQRETKQ